MDNGGLMKYFLAILAGLLVLGGCFPPQTQSDSSVSSSPKAVYDEEFDLLVAPEYDYESEEPYADQIKATTTVTTTTTTYETKTAKPAKHPVSNQVN